MKKQIFAVMTLAAVSAFATETELDGAAVSVLPVTTSQAVTAVAVPFLELDDSGDVKVEHLVKTANLAAGDALYVYQNGLYKCWILENNQWKKQDTVYTINGSGQLVESPGAEATETLEVGTGFLLKRGSSDRATFYVYGKPSAKSSLVLSPNAKTLVGNWKVARTLQIQSPTKGDAIVIPNDTVGTRYSYNGKNWYHIDPSLHLPVQGLPTIPAGCGFWYLTAAGSSPTITFEPIEQE